MTLGVFVDTVMTLGVVSIRYHHNVNSMLSQLPLTMMDVLGRQSSLMDAIIDGSTITPPVWFTMVLTVQKYDHGVNILHFVSMVIHDDIGCHWRGFISKANSHLQCVPLHRLEMMIILWFVK